MRFNSFPRLFSICFLSSFWRSILTMTVVPSPFPSPYVFDEWLSDGIHTMFCIEGDHKGVIAGLEAVGVYDEGR